MDTLGEERYRTLPKDYYKGAKGILIVYDVSNKDSFLSINYWLKEIADLSNNNPIKLIIGNKCDLFEEKQVSY